MYRGYQLIFWGLFFISFHINLGVFQILPNFIGWAMVVSGINKLGTVYKTNKFTSTAYLALFAVFYFVIDLILKLTNPTTGSYSPLMIFSIISISLVELLVEYYILNGSAEYLYVTNNVDIAENLIKQLRVYMIVYFVNTILMCFSLTFNPNYISLIFIIIYLGLRICFMAIISRLKSYYREDISNNDVE